MNVAGMTVPARLTGGLRYTTLQSTLMTLESNAQKLNYEELKVLDDDGFVLYAYTGKSGSVSFEGAKTKDRVVTHNHPKDYGGTFSDADVINFIGLGQREIRASAKEGTYSLTANRSTKQDKEGFVKAFTGSYNTLLNKGYANMKKLEAQGASQAKLRKALCDELHNWYSENCSKYGYTYTFTPNRDYHLV